MTAEAATAIDLNNPLTREAPHSTDAEQALLGALMNNNDLYDELSGLLHPHHFYHEFYAEVYATAERLFEKNFRVDAITIKENLKDAKRFEELDINQMLVDMMANAYLLGKISDHARIIIARHNQRELLKLTQQLASEAHEASDFEALSALINQAESTLFELGEGGTSNQAVQSFRESLQEVVRLSIEARNNKGDLLGATSGFMDLDKMLGGFQKGDLIILAARPSMGKTALALNVATAAASALNTDQTGGAKVAIFSLEMSAVQLSTRIISSITHLESQKIERGMLSDEEMRRLQGQSEAIADLPIDVIDVSSLNISTLRVMARRLKRQQNIGMIIVDYLQLMSSSSRKADANRVQEISEISRGLKQIAREIEVPIIALSQLSRSVESRENKRPQLSDLRESGSIEQDADVVLFLYREAYYKERQFGPIGQWNEEQKRFYDKIKNVAELYVSKNRKGAVGGVTLQFTPELTLFRDYTDSKGYEQMLRDYDGGSSSNDE